jgi:hypothetical protein
MNRFMYLSKRNFSMQGIKSLYPKCINCINFKREERSCKKFVTFENYIDYNSNYELADNVRNDNTKCGESGKLFDIGKEKLEKDNTHALNAFCSFTLITGIFAFVTHCEFIAIFIPATISFFTGVIYFVDSYDCNKKINAEKKRIEDYEKFHKTINKV